MEDREIPGMNKYGGKKNDLNYDGNCMGHHFQSRTYEILGCLIFVEQSVYTIKKIRKL
jgi:hypothetical protein